jgi:hypothetical protein
MKKVVPFLLSLIFIASAPAANTKFLLGFGSGASCYFSVPHYEDSLPFRTSFSLSDSAEIGMKTDDLAISLWIPYRYVSSSPVFDDLSMRSFNSIGIGIRTAYQPDSLLGAFLAGSMQANFYHVNQKFLSFLIEAGPSFRVLHDSNNEGFLEFPLTVDFRKDITGISFGIVFRYAFTPVLQKKETSLASTFDDGDGWR